MRFNVDSYYIPNAFLYEIHILEGIEYFFYIDKNKAQWTHLLRAVFRGR